MYTEGGVGVGEEGVFVFGDVFGDLGILSCKFLLGQLSGLSNFYFFDCFFFVLLSRAAHVRSCAHFSLVMITNYSLSCLPIF